MYNDKMINNELQFKVFTENLDSYYHQLHDELVNYNVSEIGTYGKKETLFLGYFNDQDMLIAGLYGYFIWGMLYIELLWVDANYRNRKIGSELLAKAEECAIEKQTLYIRVNTASFQALDFYIKNGYATFAKLLIFIKGNSEQYDYYLVKYLQKSPHKGASNAKT